MEIRLPFMVYPKSIFAKSFNVWNGFFFGFFNVLSPNQVLRLNISKCSRKVAYQDFDKEFAHDCVMIGKFGVMIGFISDSGVQLIHEFLSFFLNGIV